MAGRDVFGAAMIVILGVATTAVAAGGSETDDSQRPAITLVRIKTDDPEITRAIARATEWSDTFRRLVEAIEKTDGMVWIVRGRCRGAYACLLLYLEVSGPH